jgi:hypothetical protein
VEKRTELIPLQIEKNLIVYVETTILPGEEEVSSMILPFDELADIIEGVANAIVKPMQNIKPDKASVEFGLEVAMESGKLTSILVKGSGKANLKITLEWGKT